VLAAGPWSGEILSRAELRLSLNLLRGAMVALDGPRLSTPVNRLQPPSDGDIALPRGRLSIAGTTSIPIAEPDDRSVEEQEIRLIRERIFNMLPGLKQSTARHSWSGVRPLFGRGSGQDVHEWSRDFTVIDHAQRDRMQGLLTVVGGKLTTFRLMAEKASDAACRQLGVPAASRTADTLIA
jgi:glycerol-3-phosphate dehydrogenase